MEIWKDIPRHEGRYQASNLGRVRSLPRIVRWKTRWGTIGERRHKGGIISPDPHHTGYLVIKLGSASKQYRLHKVIAETWIGPCPEGMIVSHSDDNKLNCRADNLEYMTNSDNVKRAYRTGRLSNRGTANGKSVLSDDLVRKIRLMAHLPAPEVARLLGIKNHNVHQVRSRGAWSHVK